MIEVDLFLGVRFTDSLETVLAPKPKSVSYHFENSLSLITHQNHQYLGKKLDQILHFEDLESQEKHVISLIKQLIPTFIPKQSPLLLLTIPRHDPSK